MRIFGTEKLDSVLVKLGLKNGEAITHPWVNRALQKAQEKVEGRNFEIRKNLLRFDDVMNDQRKEIFEQRKDLMKDESISEFLADIRNDIIEEIININIPEKAYVEQWNINGLINECKKLGLNLPIKEWSQKDGITEKEITELVKKEAENKFQEKINTFGLENIKKIEKQIMLQVVDQNWKDHLLQLDQLRQGIGLRAYAQRDPLNEYKSEAFNLFHDMLNNIRNQVTAILLNIELVSDIPERKEQETTLVKESFNQDENKQNKNKPIVSKKIGRNELCPSSGKKFKHCFGTEGCKFGTLNCKLSS